MHVTCSFTWGSGGIGRHRRLNNLSALVETLGVEPVKFGETSARNGGGNPEPSLEYV